MTDEQIKAAVLKYITDCFESDNADGLHEMDEFYTDSFNQADYDKALTLYRRAKVIVMFDD